jgi:hypothetical protein
VWRDPATGKRAEVRDAPRTYAERYSGQPDTPPDAPPDTPADTPPEGGL